MTDRRGWRLDLVASALLLLGLLVALCVLSYDPPARTANVYPPPPEPDRLLGPPGACERLSTATGT